MLPLPLWAHQPIGIRTSRGASVHVRPRAGPQYLDSAMNDIDFAVLASRWLHIGAVVVAIGGTCFVRFVMIPSAKAALDDAQQERLRQAVRTRWARLVMMSITVLLVTGGFNFVMLGMRSGVEPMPYHAFFGIKVLAAFVIFFVASALTGKSVAFDAMRAHPKKWLSLMLVLAAMIVLLSGAMAQLRGAAPGPIPALSESPEG